ncbi:MAG TPA: DUF4157 domain-containing protein [Sunxiuqinia sp.]|nr:DUF4157 domain-containing protein [Sunxiuqinia sp.]
MNLHADKTQENKSQAVSAGDSVMESGNKATFQFVDNRPEEVAQRKLKTLVNNSQKTRQAAQLQGWANSYATRQQHTIQKQKNNTGLPDTLKSGVENLSGYSMDDVNVHRNSDKPAKLQAHAYAQGTDIHLAPGQEKHLPHEAWHVVQQKQGRVKPTMQMKGKVNVNDDAELEKEADVMGAKALQRKGKNNEPAEHMGGMTGVSPQTDKKVKSSTLAYAPIIQGYGELNIPEDAQDDEELSSNEQVELADDDDFVIIARVVTPTQRLPQTKDVKEGLYVSLTKMFGAELESNPDTEKPSDDAVAEYVAQSKTEAVEQLIEFTTDLVKVGGFAKESNRAYTIHIRIQKKYLNKSESAESGWMAYQSAPYEIVKGEMDDIHAEVENRRMSAEELQSALAEELDAKFMLEVQKRGVNEVFQEDSKNREKYISIMERYLSEKKTE